MSGRLLAAELRAGRRRASARLRAALRRHGGSVRDACEDLGLHRATLYRLAETLPDVRRVLDDEAMGRTGAAARGAAARASETRGVSRDSGKKQG